MTTSPRACGPRLGHVFPPDATFGDVCACGVYQRGHGDRSMLAVDVLDEVPGTAREPAPYHRRTLRARRRR